MLFSDCMVHLKGRLQSLECAGELD